MMNKLLDQLGGDKFTFQTFDDSSEKRNLLARTLNGTYEQYEQQLRDLNEKGAGVFVTINETDGKGRRAENVLRARAVWIDDDNKGTVVMPSLPPTLTVETSPSKYHHYWIFREPTDSWDQWEALQATMVAKFGSDPSVQDRARVLRLPDFYHCKGDPFLVTAQVCGSTYPFSVLVDEFGLTTKTPKDEAYTAEATESALDKAISAILSGDNFNNSLDTLSMHWANKGYSAFYIEQLLGGLLAQTSCTDTQRVTARQKHIPTYARTALEKSRKVEFKTRPSGQSANVKYTDIPMPPGMLGRIAENVLEFMRFPNKEIAIITALHTVSVFAGRRYSFLGKGLTARRILLAPQAIGKNTTNKYIQACVYGLQMPSEGADLPRLVDAHKYLISGDFTAVRPIHQELEEFATRSMILSEAGQVGKSDAGDKLGLKAYMLQLLSRSANEFILPKRYSVKKGDGELKPVYDPCAVILHESVPDNYAEVMRDGGEFADGSMARSDLVHVNFERTSVRKNLNHASAVVSPEILDFLANLAQKSLRGIPSEGTVPIAPNQRIEARFASDAVEWAVNQLDDENDRNFDRALNDVDTALCARKMERFFITALVLAVADNAESPKVEMEHFEWVKAYQAAMEVTVRSMATVGTFSGGMDKAINAVRVKIEQAFSGSSKTWSRAIGGADSVYCLNNQLFTRRYVNDSLSHDKDIKAFSDTTARGNKRAAFNSIFSEMISLGDIRMLTDQEKKDNNLGTGDWYQYLFRVDPND